MAPARRAHRRGHRQQLQLVRRVSRGLRPRAGRRRNQVGSRADVAARGDPVGARRGPLHAPTRAAGRARGVVSQRAHRSRHLAAGAGGVRAAGAARRSAQAAGRRRARRVPGDRRLQRRLGRARAARRGAASARGRLRVRRFGAEPDGADARAEAAVLQGRSGHAAREDSRRRVRRVHRRAVHAHRACGPKTGLGAAIVDSPGNLPYDVQRLAHETWDEVRAGGRRRATLDDLHQALQTAARRAADDVRSGCGSG